MSDYALEALDISKRFPGVKALDGVEFRVRPGEVHALLGENGAGKSTLIKVIFGIHDRDGGLVRVEGQEIKTMTPRLAHALGMAMIPQERTLVAHMTVGENLFLGRESAGRWGIINRDRLISMADDYLKSLDVDIDSRAIVASLGAGAQQLVELVRALMCNARIVFMDEPTSGLTDIETQTLFRIINRLRKQGVAVVYITHRLEEVFHLTDRVTVLRDGHTVATLNTSDTTSEELVTLMAGKAISDRPTCTSVVREEILLEVTGLNKVPKLTEISFEVKKGEIVGLVGLLGSGRSELLKCIFGSERIDSGKIKINGFEHDIQAPAQAISAGMGFLPENRRREGLCLQMTSADNMVLASPEETFLHGVMRASKKTAIAAETADYVAFNRKNLGVECRTLSGGNQQKVLLARWLSRRCDFLMLDEPTSGVDVAAKAEIHNLVREVASEGKGILVASSDFPELLNLCHRLLILRDGQIVMNISNSGISERELLGYAAGQQMGA